MWVRNNVQDVKALTENTAHLSVRLYRGKPVKRMHVMMKPTGSLCNLGCSYCYYLSNRSNVRMREIFSGTREYHE